jgi:hypothetical protein
MPGYLRNGDFDDDPSLTEFFPLPLSAKVKAASIKVTVEHYRFGLISSETSGTDEEAFNRAWAKAFRKLANLHDKCADKARAAKEI